MSALPQCIQSAKQLYDLRERYKDASVLITAIYSESMVIAASLSQVQNLLQHDALQQKPQLLETFDRALTGCRIVYGCLDEEVRDLVDKVERNDLRFKDRARYLWKEDTFKELLTQIRGQQSALTLLIQGLQMESMADIRKLVEDNSTKLDQVMKRSRTLRQSHPRVQVPESIISYESGFKGAEVAESIVKSTQFDFDEQVVNSKAYRRAMARYTMNTTDMAHLDLTDLKEPEATEIEVAEEDSTMVGTIQGLELEHNTVVATRTRRLVDQITSGSEDDVLMALPKTEPRESSVEAKEVDDPEHLKQDTSHYIISTTQNLTPARADTFNPTKTEVDAAVRVPLRSFSEGSTLVPTTSPALPPRRTSGPQLRPQDSEATLREEWSKHRDGSLDTSDAGSIMSRVSEGSEFKMNPSKPSRKPLPLAHKASYAIIGKLNQEPDSHIAESPLRSSEMHRVWLLLVEAERNFFDRMGRLRKMFYDNIIRQWPALEPHLSIVLICEQLAAVNKKLLWLPMEQQLLDSDQSICDPAIFNTWTTNVQRLFREYCQALPHAVGAVRATQSSDTKFAPFVNTLGLSIAYFGKDWEDYMRLPLTDLDVCIASVRSLLRITASLNTPAADKETQRLARALDALSWLQTTSTSLLEEAQSREDTQDLERRVSTLDTDVLAKLDLLAPERRVAFQGAMTMKLRSKGPWHPVHVVLLDNYLFWGKLRAQKKSGGAGGGVDKILVLEEVSSPPLQKKTYPHVCM